MAKRQEKKTNGNGANLGFEQTLWLAADKLRNNMDAAEYKRTLAPSGIRNGPAAKGLTAMLP